LLKIKLKAVELYARVCIAWQAVCI